MEKSRERRSASCSPCSPGYHHEPCRSPRWKSVVNTRYRDSSSGNHMTHAHGTSKLLAMPIIERARLNEKPRRSANPAHLCACIFARSGGCRYRIGKRAKSDVVQGSLSSLATLPPRRGIGGAARTDTAGRTAGPECGPCATGCRPRVVGRSEISCNEIALSTELTLPKEG